MIQNTVRQSHSRKIADLNNWLDLRTLCKCSTLRICCSICGANLFSDLRIGICGFAMCGPPSFLADLKLPKVCKSILFLLTNISHNALCQILSKIKQSLKKTTPFCGFAICRLNVNFFDFAILRICEAE